MITFFLSLSLIISIIIIYLKANKIWKRYIEDKIQNNEKKIIKSQFIFNEIKKELNRSREQIKENNIKFKRTVFILIIKKSLEKNIFLNKENKKLRKKIVYISRNHVLEKKKA